MSRFQRFALAMLLLCGSMPVWAGAMPACAPGLRAAARACCGTHCACPKSSCSCRVSPVPAGPAPAQGAIPASTATADPQQSWMTVAHVHPAATGVVLEANRTPGANLAACPEPPHLLDCLVALQI